MKFSSLISLLFLFLFPIACKTRANRTLQKKPRLSDSNIQGSSIVSERQNVDPAADPDFQIHLFDGEERIYVLPPDFMEEQRNSLKASPPNPEAEFNEAAFENLMMEDLENTVAEVMRETMFQENEAGGLNFTRHLPWSLKTEMSVKKGAFRKLEDVRWGYFTLQAKAKKFFGLKKGATGDPAKDYFYDAVWKKWNREGSQENFEKFNQIKINNFDVRRFKTVDGKNVVISASLMQRINDNLFLGMVPDKKILEDVRAQGGKRELNVVSMVQEFELQEGLAKIKYEVDNPDVKVKREAINTDKADTVDEKLLGSGERQDLGKGRYRIVFEVQDKNLKEVGINNWTEYGTPDRNMMTGEVARQAMVEVATNIRAGKLTYVHCKSGKGRSGSVVVGAIAMLQLKELKAAGVVMDRKVIDDVLKNIHDQTKAARPELNVSAPQYLNVQKILYDEMGLTR